MRMLFIVSAAILFVAVAAAQSQPQLNIMPMPDVVQFEAGKLRLLPSFSVAVDGVKDATLERGVQRFVAELSREAGMPLRNKTPESVNPSLVIHAEHRSAAVSRLGDDESYELAVTESGAKLTAPNSLGILHGLQTFLQLVGPGPDGFALPAVSSMLVATSFHSM